MMRPLLFSLTFLLFLGISSFIFHPFKYLFLRFQHLIVWQLLHVNRETFGQVFVFPERGGNGYLFFPGVQWYPQAVAAEKSEGGGKFYVRGIEGDIPAILQQSIYINVVVRAFFKAIGIRVEINTVHLLGKGKKRT